MSSPLEIQGALGKQGMALRQAQDERDDDPLVVSGIMGPLVVSLSNHTRGW